MKSDHTVDLARPVVGTKQSGNGNFLSTAQRFKPSGRQRIAHRFIFIGGIKRRGGNESRQGRQKCFFKFLSLRGFGVFLKSSSNETGKAKPNEPPLSVVFVPEPSRSPLNQTQRR